MKNFLFNLKKQIDKMSNNTTILVGGLELAFIELIKELKINENVLWWIIIANSLVLIDWIIEAVLDTIKDNSINLKK